MGTFAVFLTKKSQKDLTRLASSDAKHIIRKLERLDVPFPTDLDIKKMSGTPGFYRLRTGSVRVLFEVLKDKKELWIRKIGYRGNIY